MNAKEIFNSLVANAGNPTSDLIQFEQRMDRNKNPHNDGVPKPPLRSEEEIIADYKIGVALTTMERMVKVTSDSASFNPVLRDFSRRFEEVAERFDR
jgi:hypothetical protein